MIEYLRRHDWRDHVGRLNVIYRSRRDAMLRALEEELPAEAHWTRPRGGLFVWATLPSYLDIEHVLARCLEREVAFVPGHAAFLDGRGRTSMRLNYSGVPEATISEGVRRMGEADELKPWLLLLAGPASDFMTGEVIVIDGGQSVR